MEYNKLRKLLNTPYLIFIIYVARVCTKNK